ncbi:MAG TPA: hypothetical protein VH480_18550 [Streptosporangiaceae bacterium]
MDPHEHLRIPGPGQVGQPSDHAPAQALASLGRIDDEPGEFHLGLVVIDPQLAVAHQPAVAVQPERLHPVFLGPGVDLAGRHGRGRMAAPHERLLSRRGPRGNHPG